MIKRFSILVCTVAALLGCPHITIAATVRTATEPWVTNRVAQAAADVLGDAQDYTDMSVSNLEVRVEAEIATNTVDIASLKSGKQDAISDLETIRSGAALGATALQSYTETDPTVPSWAKADNKPTYAYSEITGTPTAISSFTNDVGYLTSYTETDPTVPAWAKASTKPTYRAEEVGIGIAPLPGSDKTLIIGSDFLTWYAWALQENKPTYGWSEITNKPTNVSAFTNDAGYLTSYTESDPTVPSWAKADNKPTYAYSEITGTPTAISSFTNDAGYLTEHQSLTNYYTKAQVDAAISNAVAAAVAAINYDYFMRVNPSTGAVYYTTPEESANNSNDEQEAE